MNTDDPNSNTQCPICKNLRPLREHLFELAEFCRFLGNTNEYIRHGRTRLVRTEIIGEWLKLAAELESVEINSWKFADDAAMYCETIADGHTSNSKHFSEYSTVLTRFIFICNAVEELYRYMDSFYLDLNEIVGVKKFADASMRATVLVDRLDESQFPVHFEHLAKNLYLLFQSYQSEFQVHLTGMENVDVSNKSYSLHLIRNLRNNVMHGIFPILENPEYSWPNTPVNLMQLLIRASRVACLYVQALIVKYNSGFQSDVYEHIVDYSGHHSNSFVNNCTLHLGLTLHVKIDFSFQDVMAGDDME